MNALLQSLVRRRQESMDQLWAVEDSAAAPDLPEVVAAAQLAAEQLQEIVREWEAAGEALEPKELGKTFRYLGDAHFSVSRKKEAGPLQAARAAYERGEPLLETGADEIELAKLRFNLGNTLRCMANGRNRRLMEEAKRLYHQARSTLATKAPEHLDLIETSLETLEAQLRALGFFESAAKGKAELEQLQQTLASAAPDDTSTDEKVAETLKKRQTTEASPAEMIDQVRSFFEQAQSLFPNSGKDAGSASANQKIQADLAAMADDFSGGKNRKDDEMFAAIFAELKKAGGRGEVSGEREAALQAMLEKFQGLVRTPAKTPEAMLSRLGRMRGVIAEGKHIFTEQKAEKGRAAAVDRNFAKLRGFLMDEMNQPQLLETEQQVAFELYGQASRGRAELKKAEEDDAALLAVEHDSLRPFAYSVRRFALRNHLMFAEPLWGWTNVQTNPNAISFAGSDEIRARLDSVCRARGLTLAEKPAAWGAGEARWNQLRESALGVFDLTMQTAPERAAVCYALGSALALGVYPLVLARGQLPFDIDLAAVDLGDEPEHVLGAAIDEAMFGLFATTGSSRLEETARHILPRVTRPDPTSRLMKKRLEEATRFDPIELEKSLDHLLAFNPASSGALLLPAWPPSYPSSDEPRCFHVMPFSQSWSGAAREEVRATCEAAGVAYRRGDETKEVRIVHSIWEEICRATHIVVDLTGLNENVCLELALAHALGRKTLLVARDRETLENLFPEISKLQVRQYAGRGAVGSLGEMTETFLSG